MVDRLVLVGFGGPERLEDDRIWRGLMGWFGWFWCSFGSCFVLAVLVLLALCCCACVAVLVLLALCCCACVYCVACFVFCACALLLCLRFLCELLVFGCVVLPACAACLICWEIFRWSVVVVFCSGA